MPYVTKNEYARVLRDREFLARVKRDREVESAMRILGKTLTQKQHHKEPEMQVTFECPDLYEVNARKGEIIIPMDITRLSADILAQLLMYGIKQKITDAASDAANSAALAVTGNIRPGESKEAFAKRLREAAATVPMESIIQEAARMMTKCRDALLAGDWGKERESAPGLDQKLVDYIRTTNGPAFEKAWPGFGDRKTSDQRKAVAAWLMENPDRLDKARAKYADHLAEQAKLANVNLDDLLG